MKKRLVMVGAGHAHLTILKHLQSFTALTHDVSVINSNAYHYYSGMAPGMLAGIYKPQEIRFNVRKMVEDRNAKFIEDSVSRVNPETKKIYLNSGATVDYDIVSFNTGSIVPSGPINPSDDSVIKVKPIENLVQARKKIMERLKKGALKITVAGGGPTGVEIAANIRRLVDNEKGTAEIELIAGGGLLPRFDRKLRHHALVALTKKDIRIIEGAKIKTYSNGSGELTDGSAIKTDLLLWAVGIRSSALFEDSGLPTGAKGGLLVNEYLQAVSHPEIFGGGDCICFAPRSLPKIGIYAVRQNPVLYHNLLATLKGGRYQKFVPQKSFMLIFNMGDGTGILCRNSLVWEGKSAFFLKNFIDSRFMKKFQVSGERDRNLH